MHHIPILEPAVRLNTSNGLSSVVGCTPLITVAYGADPAIIREAHSFLVVQSHPGLAFNLLIGNQDAIKHGMCHDIAAQSLRCAPFDAHPDHHHFPFHIPVIHHHPRAHA